METILSDIIYSGSFLIFKFLKNSIKLLLREANAVSIRTVAGMSVTLSYRRFVDVDD